VHIGLWGSPPPRPEFIKMGEDMLRTNTIIMPNFIDVGQMVYEKSVTKNLLCQSKLNIPTILPYGGIITNCDDTTADNHLHGRHFRQKI